jgi:hypothetical protein
MLLLEFSLSIEETASSTVLIIIVVFQWGWGYVKMGRLEDTRIKTVKVVAVVWVLDLEEKCLLQMVVVNMD